MDLKENWPVFAGAGLLLVLVLLSRSGSAGSGTTLQPIPTSSAGDDAVRLQAEQNKGALLGTLANSAAALTGQVNGIRGQVDITNAQYQGQAMLDQINGATQQALATLSVNRDVAIRQSDNATALASVRMTTDSANTVAKAQARASSNNGFWGAVASVGSAIIKAIF